MCPVRVAVAYSGGRDSSALLHATLAAASPLGMEVVALHVHHGLSPRADSWLEHCQSQCLIWARQGWRVAFASHRAIDSPSAGESVEAWARGVRYKALEQLAMEHGAGLVLLGHHRRDQAETFLLQALRGAGPAGLSAMPSVALRNGLTWARPWLDRPREEIDAYLSRHRLKFIEDESNGDPRFARSRLRVGLWPSLVSSFPHAEESLVDSARWAQEAASCLHDLARLDMAPLLTLGNGLDVAGWWALSIPRRSNVLREWLKGRVGLPPPSSLVRRLMEEVRPSGTARWPIEGGELRLYRGVVSHSALMTGGPAKVPVQREASLSIGAVGRFDLPGWGGSLQVTDVRTRGVPLAWLGRVDLKPRKGGERFRAEVGRPLRSLKKHYQATGVAEWHRQGPLVYSGGQLVFVPGLGIDARVMGLDGQPQVALQWVSLSDDLSVPGDVQPDS